MSDCNDKMINRIRKLIALADNARNSSEAEAQAAALKVQELLQDYGLSMAEVEAADGEAKPDTVQRDKIQVEDRAAHKLWQRNLMSTLADNNFCYHVVRETRIEEATGGASYSRRHTLIGRTLNIEVTLSTYDYLCKSIARAALAAGFQPRNKRDWNVFYEGAVERLQYRLHEARRERELQEQAARTQAQARGEAGTALVLTDVYGSEADLNNDVLNNFPPGTTVQQRRERAAKEEARKIEQARMEKEGMGHTEAFYRSHGYSEEQSKAYATRYDTSQKRRATRRHRGHTMNWTQADRNRSAKRNSRAYREGAAAGGSISLSRQVGGSETTRRLS